MAQKEYDNITSVEDKKIRSNLGAEADSMGLKGVLRGNHIKKILNPYLEERKTQRASKV